MRGSDLHDESEWRALAVSVPELRENIAQESKTTSASRKEESKQKLLFPQVWSQVSS